MEYDLIRIDYTLCGITYPDTLKILPAYGQRAEQKIAIGDKNGVLQCLSFKDEEPVVQFKTLPGKPITSVQLATTSGTQSDKIFTASGNEVKGYTKKGKMFLSIETSLSDTITSMNVIGSDLILCSGQTVTYYKDLKEYQSYVCEDRVLDIAAFIAPNTGRGRVRLVALIANKGAIILENGQILARTTILSGPTRLGLLPTSQSTDVLAFYGASDGSIGLITFEGSVFSSKCLVEGRGLGSVVCFGWFFNNSGTHLAVGRYDGSVQLYLIDLENVTEKPRLMFTYLCGEPVTSVCGGCVGTNEGELIVATFSGRIFALRNSRFYSGAASLPKVSHDNLAARRAKLEMEIARLEKQTFNEREKYQRNTRSMYAGLSTPPLLNIQYEMTGATKEGWQELQIISAVPLDMLFIYCNKKLDMITDNAAVLSLCSSMEKASDILATVRCQAGMRRVWLRMRDIKTSDMSVSSLSESKQVLVYILPAGAPRVARLINVKLPALPYYSHHEELDSDIEKKPRPWCQLKASGSFSVAEITSWLTDVFPGELPRPAANIAFARSHTLLETILICKYQRGTAVFKSDDVTALAIMRNIISIQSVKKGIRVEISFDAPDNYCIESFILVQNKVVSEFKKHSDINLRNALRSLDLEYNSMNSEDPTLCEDYMHACQHTNDDSIETYFMELVDTIVLWYANWHTLCLHGHKKKNSEQSLTNALKECNLEDIANILKI